MSRFLHSLAEETRRLTGQPVRWMGCLVLPLFALLFMYTVFGSGAMDCLPVGVVDEDYTRASRQLVRQVDASPSLQVVRHFTDDGEARQALRRGEVYGYLRIPHHYEQRLLTGQPVSLLAVCHYALLSVGRRVSTAFRTAIAGDALPFTGLTFPERNVNLNYSVYLSYPFFIVLMQALCLLLTIYVWGRDGGLRTASPWQWVAKMAPYAACYAAVSLLAQGACLMWLASVALIVATQALGMIILRLSPDFSTAMSAGSMVGSLGATLCGVTFPLFAMEAPVRWAAAVFPIRWFMSLWSSAYVL
jgi:hypothetical protein